MNTLDKKLATSTATRSVTRTSVNQRRTIDEFAIKRRVQKQLENLERDNFQDDPHANLVWSKAAPKFNDELVSTSHLPKVHRKRVIVGSDKAAENATKKGRKLVAEFTKTRFRKTFTQLLEEEEHKIIEVDPNALRTFSDIKAPPSRYPARKFCSVCGLFAKYTCIKCHDRYCSLFCGDRHSETRC